MAYIETIKKGKNNFYYLTQTVRVLDKFKKVRWFLGKGDIPQDRLKVIAKNVEKNLKDKVKSIKNVKEVVVFDKETLKKLQKIKINYQKLISSISNIEYGIIEKDHLINFTFNTNAIEGSTITLKETTHILEDKITPEGKSLREVHEIENTSKAYEFMKEYKGDVSINFIEQIHYNLTYNILGNEAGVFRKIQVYMGGSKHIPSKPSEIKNEMRKLIQWIKNHRKIHQVIKAVYVHHYFIAIHPFIDGNGRTGRLLLNFMLMKAGYPPICIKKEERIKYTDYLEDARNGDITNFLNFIVKKIEDAYQLVVDTINEKR